MLLIRKEGNVLFNDALNTFYLRLYGVRHMVKNNSDRERGNPLLPHRLLFPITSKGSFICIIPFATQFDFVLIFDYNGIVTHTHQLNPSHQDVSHF